MEPEGVVMAGYFKLEKIGKRHTNIIDAKSGELLCQLRNPEVESWVRRATKARDDEAAFKIEARARRIEIVRDYLAWRRVREADRGVQLSFGFASP